jgi:dipeptide transport system permease protein
MIRFLLNRLLLIVPTFIGITILAFAFVRVLPDAARAVRL